jgi:hypothetical protein
MAPFYLVLYPFGLFPKLFFLFPALLVLSHHSSHYSWFAVVHFSRAAVDNVLVLAAEVFLFDNFKLTWNMSLPLRTYYLFEKKLKSSLVSQLKCYVAAFHFDLDSVRQQCEPPETIDAFLCEELLISQSMQWIKDPRTVPHQFVYRFAQPLLKILNPSLCPPLNITFSDRLIPLAQNIERLNLTLDLAFCPPRL